MFRFVLTLACLVAAADFTKIQVDQVFTCKYQKNWQMSILYYEFDLLTKNERLFETAEVKVTNRGKATVSENFDVTGGDGRFDPTYDMYMKVTHTCSRGGGIVEHKKFLGLVDVDSETASFGETYELGDFV